MFLLKLLTLRVFNVRPAIVPYHYSAPQNILHFLPDNMCTVLPDNMCTVLPDNMCTVLPDNMCTVPLMK